MSEVATVDGTPADRPGAGPSVIVDDLYLTYRVMTERRRRLRDLLTRSSRDDRRAREVEAIRGVDLTVYPGDAIGVIGRNGSGKSTLLGAIAGLLKPTSGHIYASSVPVLLGVSSALQTSLSGRRNVYIGGTALGIPRDDLERRFDEIVEFAGVADYIDLPLRAFSSGMRARLQFAIATAQAPDILLIDETLAVGDAEFRQRSRERIREMIGGASTVFVVSHNLKVIRAICNRAVWVDEGEIIAEGDEKEVVRAYNREIQGLD